MDCRSGESEYRALGARSSAAGIGFVIFQAQCHDTTDVRDGSTTTIYYWSVAGLVLWGETTSGACDTFVAGAGWLGCPAGGPPSLAGLP